MRGGETIRRRRGEVRGTVRRGEMKEYVKKEKGG
jgi:hypothetical protein